MKCSYLSFLTVGQMSVDGERVRQVGQMLFLFRWRTMQLRQTTTASQQNITSDHHIILYQWSHMLGSGAKIYPGFLYRDTFVYKSWSYTCKMSWLAPLAVMVSRYYKKVVLMHLELCDSSINVINYWASSVDRAAGPCGHSIACSHGAVRPSCHVTHFTTPTLHVVVQTVVVPSDFISTCSDSSVAFRHWRSTWKLQRWRQHL